MDVRYRPHIDDLEQPGDFTFVSNTEGKRVGIVTNCAKCNRTVSCVETNSGHKIGQEEPLTIIGSLRCYCKEDCDAHYHIQNGKVVWA